MRGLFLLGFIGLTWRGGGSPRFLLSSIMIQTLTTDTSFDKYEEYRLHMETLLSASLTDFDIPGRILIPLGDAGIRRLRDLVAMTKKQLLSVSRMGVVSVEFLENFLAKQNLSLKK